MHAHTLTRAHCRSSYPYSSAYLPRTFSLLTALPGEKRRAAATAGISCSRTTASPALPCGWQQQPTPAESEREGARERERHSGSVLYRPFVDGASAASAVYGLLARAAVKKAADRGITAQRNSTHARPGEIDYSVVYSRTVVSNVQKVIKIVVSLFKSEKL